MRLPAVFPFCFAATLAAQTPFCSQIRTLTEGSPSHWGVSVNALDGTPLCGIDDAKLFRPASNNKIFTTAAALALVGAEHTFETRVTGRLDPKTGAVQGDLTLVGGGDANLDAQDLPYVHSAAPHPPLAFHDLEDLAKQLAAQGVKTVNGDVVGDDTLFPYEPYGFSWELDDLVYGFGAPVSVLTIADNQLALTITPAKTGVAEVSLDQHGLGYYTVVADVNTVPANATGVGVQLQRLPGSRILRVFGSVRQGAEPEVEHIAIDDPAAFAALAFRSVLAEHGIVVKGSWRSQHAPVRDGIGFLEALRLPDAGEAAIAAGGASPKACSSPHPAGPPTLAVHLSAPLGQDVVFTDKTSQNLHAELLLHAVAERNPCAAPSTVEGARMIRAFLLHAGVQPDDFVLYDGSGLSSHDLVAPRAFTQLLGYAAKQPWFADFKAALPVGGVDGSLAGRFTETLRGKVFAKTGSLGETRTLSGYLTAASGNTVIFSIMVDNHPPGSSADRQLMDQVVEQIAATN
jgi:D-alanyl-D-alanine carboxypeptidase/D-alanyl-D-alanine-endopeptidase (penicillin-binding protein 4)